MTINSAYALFRDTEVGSNKRLIHCERGLMCVSCLVELILEITVLRQP